MGKADVKAIAFKALREQGINKKEAGEMIGVHPKYVHALEKKSLPSLKDYSLVKQAKKSIKSLAQGQKVGDMEDIKGSDVLGACKEIYARAEPIVQRIESESRHMELVVSLDVQADIRQGLQAIGVIEGEIEDKTGDSNV